MNKQEFLNLLRNKLSGLRNEDIEERIEFYSEMIEDRIEEGMSESAAVRSIGLPSEIASQIIAETPIIQIVKEKTKLQRRLKCWEIVCLLIGSPIWLTLMISVVAIILSVYIVLWVMVISLWAVCVSLVASAVGGIVASVIFLCRGYGVTSIATLGACFVVVGLSILVIYLSKVATKSNVLLLHKMFLAIKKFLLKKRRTNYE